MSNVNRILQSGFLSEGDEVRHFEQALEQEFGMRNVVAVNSCTSALHLALVLAGVGQGDEVILPAQTFVATGEVIVQCGATPVFADIGMDGNIDVEDVSRKHTERTKAIIAVSWGGNPCDLIPLTLYDLTETTVIQDNAHALGATLIGQPLSKFGDFSCYSFQAIKALSSGDGGAITCNRKSEYERAKKLRWFGIDREKDLPDETGERQYNLEEIGYKYHMNNVAAAIGLGNMHGFKERQERVKQIAKIYDEEIGAPYTREKKDGCSYWLYDLTVNNRPEFIRAMKSRGVPVSVVHKGIHKHPVFNWKGELPMQEYWDKHHVCLPIHSSLTDEDVEKVVSSVKQGW